MDKISILYIEDDDKQRRTLVKQLRSKGFKVTASKSGQTGLDLFESRTFDVILCDLHMTPFTGLDILDRVRKKDPDIPFIILTAHGDVNQAVKAIKKGAQHFILKPPEINEIDISVRQTIEQTRVQKELNESQEILRLIYENIPDIIYSMSPRGEFISISPSAEVLLGYKPSRYIGKSVLELIHPDDVKSVREALVKSVKTGKPKVRVREFRMISKNGEIRHFEVSRKLVLENGRVVRIDGIARDITERKTLERRLVRYSSNLEHKNAEMESLLKELSLKKDELQAIIDSSPDTIFMVDNNGTIQEINQRVHYFFGLHPEEIVHGSIDDFTEKIKDHFRDFEKFHGIIEQLKKTPDCSGSCAGQISPSILFDRSVELSHPRPAVLIPFSVSVHDENGKETGRVWVYGDITAIKRADELLHKIVSASPIPTIISRIEDGKILYANDQLASLVGLTASELVGRNTPDFYYNPDDRKIVLEHLRRDGYLNNFETQIKRVDGSVIWMLFSIVTTEISGEPVILGGLYDINKRKIAEEALEKERNFVSAVLDTAGALVVVLDQEGRIVRFNRACEETTGYSFSEALGNRIWDFLLLPDEKDRVKSIFKKLQSGKYPSTAENYWLTKDGEPRLISWSNTVLLDENGKVEYVIATGIDITEHRESDEKMKLYREIFMNARDGIVITNADGQFIERNPAHKRNTGIPDTEITNLNVLDFLQQSGEEIASRLKKDGSFRGEVQGQHADGSRHSVDLSIFPIRSETGEIVRYAGIARDISAIKKVLNDLEEVNKNLRDTQSQLVQSEKMASLGTLVAGVAHEINTPIGAVSSMQDTLFRTLEKLKGMIESRFPEGCADLPDIEATLKVIDDANRVIKPGTERVINIVRRLRSFARLDEAEVKTVDIHEGLEDTLVLIYHELKHNISIVKNYGDIPQIACYPGQLNQVFLNILINAKQAIRGKGKITITTSVREGKVHIAIQDSGIGIAKEDLIKVFDPGFTTKGVGVGTGLGLSICYQIIQGHRGEIKAESKPGKGSTFTIILPTNLDVLINDNQS
jgi:PAS domain S-box-containing protein